MKTSLTFAAPLLAAALCAVPAAAAPAPTGGITDSDLAAWVAEGLVTAGATPVSAETLLLSKGHRADLSIAREASAVLSRVGVRSMVVGCADGTLELRGEVADAATRDKAGDLAAAIAGVGTVANHLRLPGEEVVAADPAATSPDEAVVVEGPARTEPFHFLASEDRAGRDIVVHVTDGVVELSGEVNNDAAARWAAAAAQRIPGVRAVRREGLSIRRNDREADRRLALLIQRRLEWDVGVQTVAGAILVTARDGVVHLSGKVRDADQAEQARAVALSTTETFVVDDQLDIDQDLVVPTAGRINGFKLFRAW